MSGVVERFYKECINAATTPSPEDINVLLRSRLKPRDRFRHDHHDTCMVIERSKNLNVVVYSANLVPDEDEDDEEENNKNNKNNNNKNNTTESRSKGGEGRLCSFLSSDPLHAYWIKLEPEHVARRRARGELEDMCELNLIEKKLAYGCHASLLSQDHFISESIPNKNERKAASAEALERLALLFTVFQPCLCKYVALSAWPVLMLRLPPCSAAASTAFAEKGSGASRPASPAAPSGSASPVGTLWASPTTLDKLSSSFLPESSVVLMLAVIDNTLSVLEKVYVKSIEPKHFYQLPKVESIEAYGVSVATGEPTYEKKTG